MLHASKILLVEKKHHHFYNQHSSLFWSMQEKVRLNKFLLDIKLNSAWHSHCGTTKVNFSEELQSRLKTFVWFYEVIHRKSNWLQGVLHASGDCYCVAVIWKSAAKLLVKNANMYTNKPVTAHTQQDVSLQVRFYTLHQLYKINVNNSSTDL